MQTDIAIDDYRCVDMNNYIRGRRAREREKGRTKEGTNEGRRERKEGRKAQRNKERKTVHSAYNIHLMMSCGHFLNATMYQNGGLTYIS